MVLAVHPPQTALHEDQQDPALRDGSQQATKVVSTSDGKKELVLKPLFKGTSIGGDSTEVTVVESDEDEQQSEASSETSPICVAKAKLREMLAKHNRSSKHPEVMKAVDELSALNPTSNAVLSPHLEGCFINLSRAEFPGRLQQEPGKEHIDQFTLGRMSFGIFQPKDLVCTVIDIRNDLNLVPSLPPNNSDDNEGASSNKDQQPELPTYTYPVATRIIITTPKGDFPASLNMRATCKADKVKENRLAVSFTGGTLTPGEEVRSDPTQLALWKEVFADAYKKAEEERSYVSRILQYVFKWMFQLTTPTDQQALENDTNSVSFEMKRCPDGYLDVLFLDEDIRITRGNRGTIVIVERVTEEAKE